MLKQIIAFSGGQKLSKKQQCSIYGGSYYCTTPNSFFCTPELEGHVCCRGMCVLPSHPACSF